MDPQAPMGPNSQVKSPCSRACQEISYTQMMLNIQGAYMYKALVSHAGVIDIRNLMIHWQNYGGLQRILLLIY